MIYEIRVYEALEGRTDAMRRRFLDVVAAKFFPRHGIEVVGHGNGTARFEIAPEGATMSRLTYQGVGEIGGLVAGVGQRILRSVSKYLVGRFFTALRKEFETSTAAKE